MHRPGNRAFHGLPCAWSPANTRFRGFSDRGPIRPRARPGRAKPARRGGQCAGVSRRAVGASSFRDRRRPGGQVAGRATMGAATSNPSPAISSRVVTFQLDLARLRPTTSRSSDGRARETAVVGGAVRAMVSDSGVASSRPIGLQRSSADRRERHRPPRRWCRAAGRGAVPPARTRVTGLRCQACRSALIFITRSSFRSKQSPPAFSSARLNSSVSRSWSSFDSSFLAMG